MIQIHSFPPQPLCSQQPFPQPFPNPLPQQQHRIRISQIVLQLFPPLLQLQSHPQFVAARSLIVLFLRNWFTLHHMSTGMSLFPHFQKFGMSKLSESERIRMQEGSSGSICSERPQNTGYSPWYMYLSRRSTSSLS